MRLPRSSSQEKVEARRDGRSAAQPRRQRGLLRRREEAQRDLPDGGARADARDPRRDRLRSRHRRAEDRRRGRQRAARRRSARFIVITHYQRLLDYIVPDFVHVLADGPHRHSPATRSSRSSSKRRATPGSSRSAGGDVHELRDRLRPTALSRRDARSRVRAGRPAPAVRLAATRPREAPGPFPRAGHSPAPRRGLALHEHRPARHATCRSRLGRERRASPTAELARLPRSRSRRGRPRLVFVNGRFVARALAVDALPAGVRRRRAWRQALEDARRPTSRQSLGRDSSGGAPLSALNTRVPRRRALRVRAATARVVEEPIHIAVPRSTRAERRRRASADARRAGERSQRRRSSRRYVRPRAVAGAYSHQRRHGSRRRRRTRAVDHYKVQHESTERLPRRQPRGAARSGTALPTRTRSRSGRRSRATTSTRSLDGEGANCTLNGLYVGRRRAARRQPHGRSTTRCPTATSRELYKGVLDDKATRRLQRPDRRASRTRRRRTRSRPTRTCCSPTRRRATRSPQLEIYADDVQVHARRDDRPARRGLRSSTCARGASASDAAREPADLRVRRRTWSSGLQLPPMRERLRRVSFPSRLPERGTIVRQAGEYGRQRSAWPSTRSCIRRSAVAARLSRPRAGRSTANRSSISTTPRRAQKPQCVIDAELDCYYEALREHPSRRPPALRRRRPRRYEDARDKVGALPRRARPRRSSSCAARPRPSTSSPQTYGREHVGRRRRDPDHAHGAPLEHRAVADAVRGDGREARGRADRRRAAS